MKDKQLIELLKTLSGVQAWALSLDESMPDYLHEDLLDKINETAGIIEQRMKKQADIDLGQMSIDACAKQHIFDTSKLMPKPDLAAPLELNFPRHSNHQDLTMPEA